MFQIRNLHGEWLIPCGCCAGGILHDWAQKSVPEDETSQLSWLREEQEGDASTAPDVIPKKHLAFTIYRGPGAGRVLMKAASSRKGQAATCGFIRANSGDVTRALKPQPLDSLGNFAFHENTRLLHFRPGGCKECCPGAQESIY